MADAAPLELPRVRWSLDESCFTIATGEGFWVYNSDPTTLIKKQDLDGGVSIAQLLNRSNIVLLVGGGEKPVDAPNRICVWDDVKGRIVHRIELKKNILNLLVKHQRLVAVVDDEVSVFSFPGKPFPKLLRTIETRPNPHALVTLSSVPSVHILACPGMQPTDVYILDVGSDKPKIGPTMVSAHKHPVTNMNIDARGELLATASSRGTIVRVYDTQRGKLLHEFRRGYTSSMLTTLQFSRDATLLCAASDQSIHLYHIANPSLNTRSVFGFYKMEGARSRAFSSFETTGPCVCRFDRQGQAVIAVCATRIAHKLRFDKRTGEADDSQAIVQLMKHNSGSLFRVDPDKWREAHRGYAKDMSTSTGSDTGSATGGSAEG
ncbi:hypothetical protein PTSG_02207 [Salpingoeca rosetta]|uniref:WD repeat domain phosphoinositide-interacting protein 3 n=1 Tax=Salpingoeca rosetta (strain ATCC 50818 / BSB-021) TaxID=946362 RepID=F2U1I8_SALR5|nr:uncharacterized protein PTSG_02207 [Salpingoeca rosetta]EGD81490.1 hypothetical protein PTSG_02207 [Salpingoeca rosetta]|eukprot:XP_004996694.1 hypothetical protein PTSG_02207 [Salpingoeca rosetta]